MYVCYCIILWLVGIHTAYILTPDYVSHILTEHFPASKTL